MSNARPPTELKPTDPGFYKYDWFNAPPGVLRATMNVQEALMPPNQYVCEVEIRFNTLMQSMWAGRLHEPFAVYFYLPPNAQRLQS